MPKRLKGTCQVHRILRSRALNMGELPTSSAAAIQGLGEQERGSLGRDPWTTPSPEDTVQRAGQPVKGVSTHLMAHVILFYVQHATRKCLDLKRTAW